MKEQLNGAQLIEQERERQMTQEGYLSEHDDQHNQGQLAAGAVIYARFAVTQQNNEVVDYTMAPCYWPWDQSEWKPSRDPVRNLIKAGALIAAEIDRLQRKQGGVR